ncbi:MAG TPA: PhzF family phenazine biosynthesis protein [Gemmatimonadaceae bacterium]|nr:PhzF family phenazine biosynthesis protein [Gemmatimonadaceae bacterium]
MELRYITADVFTDSIFGGNPLAVLPNAESIPEDRLLPITREFNYSETVFVYPPERPFNTRKLRIFTPGGEIPFAGHPTVGTAHVLAATGDVPLTADETRITFEEGVGLVPVKIVAQDGAPVFCQLSAARMPEIGPALPPNADLAAMLSLEEDDILTGAFHPQSVSCGLPFVYVPLRDRHAVARARLNLDRWERALKGQFADMIFVFSLDAQLPSSDVHARMFGPGANVPEDPATGSACTALGGYLAMRANERNGTLRWVVEQGFEMGRPSILDVEADLEEGKITALRVGGNSVLVMEGTLRV